MLYGIADIERGWAAREPNETIITDVLVVGKARE